MVEIRESDALRKNPKTGEVVHTIQAHHLMITKEWKTWEKTKGFQLKYVYFIDKSYKANLSVPILPFSKIDEMGAGMYKGQSISLQERRAKEQASEDHSDLGGATPTCTLQSKASL